MPSVHSAPLQTPIDRSSLLPRELDTQNRCQHEEGHRSQRNGASHVRTCSRAPRVESNPARTALRSCLPAEQGDRLSGHFEPQPQLRLAPRRSPLPLRRPVGYIRTQRKERCADGSGHPQAVLPMCSPSRNPSHLSRARRTLLSQALRSIQCVDSHPNSTSGIRFVAISTAARLPRRGAWAYMCGS